MSVQKYKRGRPTIGVPAGWQVYAGTLDTFLGHVFRGIQAAARDRECNLLMACGVGSARDAGRVRPAWPFLSPEVDSVPVGPWNADGLIIVSSPASEAGKYYFLDLVASGYPAIYAGDRDFGPAVVVDNEGGIHEALHHLFEHGHRRIAFIAGREQLVHGDSGIRLRAYKSGLQKLGLASDPDLIAIGSHAYSGGPTGNEADSR